ncbi:MAG: electron transport complex subunit RsxC [Candidatus Eutrophobiaceae bacterium]
MSLLLDQPIPFGGGVSLPSYKEMSLGGAIETLPIPELLRIPVRQHHGAAAEPIVEVGEKVDKGQLIAKHRGYISLPVHASSSGEVIAIGRHPVPNPSGHLDTCISIRTDGRDALCSSVSPCADYQSLDPYSIQQRMLDAGIAGMGGAGFPAAVKLIPGMAQRIRLLILNAAECEPYITCDHACIRERADELIAGLDILCHASQAELCVIGMEEDNSADEARMLEDSIARIAPGRIGIRLLPARYPAGGERQMIKALTGNDMPDSGLPVDMGIMIYNVGTVLAVYDAIVLGQPSLGRVVTVSGSGVRHPGNLAVRYGTPIADLAAHCGGVLPDHGSYVIGGPMMGYRTRNLEVPVTKITNCVLILGAETAPLDRPCIHCGECVDVCPEYLLPHELLRAACAGNAHGLEEGRLSACIECGCCSYVCPSHIPLVDIYREAKGMLLRVQRQGDEAPAFRARYEAKCTRDALERGADEPILGIAKSLEERQRNIAASVQRRQKAGKS